MKKEIMKNKVDKEIRRWRRRIKEEGGEEEWHRTLVEIKKMQRHTQRV